MKRNTTHNEETMRKVGLENLILTLHVEGKRDRGMLPIFREIVCYPGLFIQRA